MSNGAVAEVGMILMERFILNNEEINIEQFSSGWTYAQSAANSWPETSRNAILAVMEVAGEKGMDNWMQRLSRSIEVCMSESESQQSYVDLWRDLALSGLLSFDK